MIGVALAAALLLLPGADGLAETTLPAAARALPAGPAAGSATVLQQLWSAQQLRGRRDEARITRERPADREPPPSQAVLPAPEPVAPPLRRSIRRVVPRDGAKLVALTFDLCEAAGEVSGYDGAVIDALRAEQVAATLFAGGKWLRSHPERAMQLMADSLFEIGNHGWSHANLRTLPEERAREEILWTQLQARLLRDQLVQRAIRAGVAPEEAGRIPEQPAVFRFPYGACRPETLALANAAGLAAIQWDVVSGDADPAFTPEMVAKEVLGRVKPGSIVVMHANGKGRGTAGALPAIIRSLRQKGFQFVTVSRLLAAGDVVAADECYEIRPGDTQRYDAKAAVKGAASAKPARAAASKAGASAAGGPDGKPAPPPGDDGG